MLINSAPFALTVEKLRAGQMDLIAYVDEMCDRVAKLDSRIEAMLQEPDRRGRVRSEARELQARYPDPATSAAALWRAGCCEGYFSRIRLCYSRRVSGTSRTFCRP